MRKELFILGIFFLFSCSATRKMQSNSNITDVFLVQGGKSLKIGRNDQKVIAKAPFSLQFYGKRYTEAVPNAILVAALMDQSVFDKVTVGAPKESLANFGPATGLAGMTTGYEALFINDYGHHYLYYKDEQSHRLKIIKEEGENLKFDFDITKFFIYDDFYAIEKSPISTIYLVIFIDRNSDGIMDAGELTKLTLKLK